MNWIDVKSCLPEPFVPDGLVKDTLFLLIKMIFVAMATRTLRRCESNSRCFRSVFRKGE